LWGSIGRRVISMSTEIGIGTYSPKTLNVVYDHQAHLKIGKFCSIGSDVTIYLGGNHRWDWLTTHPIHQFFNPGPDVEGYPQTNGDVTIGNDVWIGDGVKIFSGVNIPDGCVIGAYSVVRQNSYLNKFGIYIGNPCLNVSHRISADKFDRSCKVKWWDWPLEFLKEYYPLLQSGDYERMINIYKENEEKLLLNIS
jgi:acetyltransferase-like isoleucine patch superfamily enzyme